MLRRICFALAKGLNDKSKLLKYIIIVLDDDIIQMVSYDQQGVLGLYGRLLEFLVDEIQRMIRERKAALPAKAVKFTYPTFYWVAAPTNRALRKAESRIKFNLCLDSVLKKQSNMHMLKFKDHWLEDDNELFTHNGKISEYGYFKYWKAIDASFKYNVLKFANQMAKFESDSFKSIYQEDLAQITKHDLVSKKTKNEIGNFFQRNRKNDKFHWNRRHAKSPRFLLPRPPY